MNKEKLQDEFIKTSFKIRNLKEDKLKIEMELIKEEEYLNEIIDEFMREDIFN